MLLSRSPAVVGESFRRQVRITTYSGRSVHSPEPPMRPMPAHRLRLLLRSIITGFTTIVPSSRSAMGSVRRSCPDGDDLLDASRISRGRIEFRMEPVDRVAVVRRTIEASLPLIRERGH